MRHWLMALLCVCSTACLAWELQPQTSSISFTVAGADGAIEGHRFGQLQGTFDGVGMLLLTIPLASVDTSVEERDQAIRNQLFEVAKFPNASFLALVDMDPVNALAAGAQVRMPVKGRLTLHGKTVEVAGEALVSRLADGSLTVVAAEPVLVDMEKFELGKGMKRLMRAGGYDFSTVVPVTFNLTFAP
jgi:polyisoprenoid-binding protein YceI